MGRLLVKLYSENFEESLVRNLRSNYIDIIPCNYLRKRDHSHLTFHDCKYSVYGRGGGD